MSFWRQLIHLSSFRLTVTPLVSGDQLSFIILCNFLDSRMSSAEKDYPLTIHIRTSSSSSHSPTKAVTVSMCTWWSVFIWLSHDTMTGSFPNGLIANIKKMSAFGHLINIWSFEVVMVLLVSVIPLALCQIILILFLNKFIRNGS